MPRENRPKQVPKRAKEAADPDPDMTPHIPEEPKGHPSSRLDESREPGEDEEKRRVVEKLREREQDS
jgi:hypothetical protein